MKKFTQLLFIIFTLLSLSACNAPDLSFGKMEIKPAKLSGDEVNICKLLGTNIQSSIFDFKVDKSVKTISLNVYQLKYGKWDIMMGGGGEQFTDTSGRIAISAKDIYEGCRCAIQSKNTNSATAIRTNIEKDDRGKGFSTATSYLSNPTQIEFEKEIPLMTQVSTSKNEIRTSFTDFETPEEIAKLGYEEVYAVTVKFSQKALTACENKEMPPSSVSQASDISESTEQTTPSRLTENDIVSQEEMMKYYKYLTSIPTETLFMSDGNDGEFSDEAISAFAIATAVTIKDFDFEKGINREVLDEITTKYFDKTVKSYESKYTTVLPNGNITSIGWSPSPYSFVLKEISDSENGAKVGVFYKVGGIFENMTYEEYLQKLMNKQFEEFGKTSLAEISFYEKQDEDGNYFLQFISAKSLPN